MVGGRVTPIVLAFVLTLAPAALQLCQASCLSHSAATGQLEAAHHHHAGASQPLADHTATAHVHHHGTPAEAPATRTAATSGPHTCSHDADLPALSATPQIALIAVAVTTSTFAITHTPQRGLPTRYDTAPGPPGLIARTTQLRV